MQRILVWVGLVLMSLVPFSAGAPVEGTSWASREIPAGTVEGNGVSEPGKVEFEKAFAAGQRACVIVIGDHNPVVDVEVKVYDAANQLVAHDRGTEPAQDFVAVMWYPPRQETYRIHVFSYGKAHNTCSITFK